MVRIDREEMLSRQSAMVSPLIGDISVAIVGVGGIGSNVADTLTRIGVQHFTLYDGDIVGEENVYPGAFVLSDVGLPKTDAIRYLMVEEFGVPEQNVKTRGKFVADDPHEYHDIWIVGTDDMPSRREVWYTLAGGIDGDDQFDMFIDARMGGKGAEIYTVHAEDDEGKIRYRRLSLDEVKTGDLPCGEKATAYITRLIAGLVGEHVGMYANGESDIPPVVQYHTGVGYAIGK